MLQLLWNRFSSDESCVTIAPIRNNHSIRLLIKMNSLIVIRFAGTLCLTHKFNLVRWCYSRVCFKRSYRLVSILGNLSMDTLNMDHLTWIPKRICVAELFSFKRCNFMCLNGNSWSSYIGTISVAKCMLFERWEFFCDSIFSSNNRFDVHKRKLKTKRT